MKQIYDMSKESFSISQDYSPAKKALGQPGYLLNLDDQWDLESASFCWVTYKWSNNIVYLKFITTYGHIRYFILEYVADQFTEKEFQSVLSNSSSMSLGNEALETIATAGYILHPWAIYFI